MSRLFHGTTADALKAIKEQGLTPRRKDEYLYATPDRTLAELYAYVRGVQRRSLGIVVEFEADGEWEPDPTSPESLRSRGPVKPEGILSVQPVPEEQFMHKVENGDGDFENLCAKVRRWLETGAVK